MTNKNVDSRNSRPPDEKEKSSAELLAFDNEKFIKLQSAAIDERIRKLGGKLYLEIGGKLLDELNLARSMPGYDPEAKIKVLEKLKDKLEIIFCINANDIEKKRIRGEHGISYDAELLRLIKNAKMHGLTTAAVVITLYDKQPEALRFKHQLARRGIKVYCHTFTKGYPTDIDTIVSAKGYGAQSYIETTKPLVVVASPGANSGKLATCLAQLYHEHKRGVQAEYAKFETLPVWDLPLKHPTNMEYEAATANIGDTNMIDNFHLEAYGQTAVNYNRDLEVFPIIKNILHRITKKDIYRSPTDMGVNMIGQCITDDDIARRASCDEIIRRYLNSLCDYKNGHSDIEVPNRIKLLMDELDLEVNDRKVVPAALKAKEKKKSEIVAIQVSVIRNQKSDSDKLTPDSGLLTTVVTGKETDIMTASAAAVINAIKELSHIDDAIHLISPINLDPILKIKREVYGETKLNLQDILIALAMGESGDENVKLALSNLKNLRGLEAHSTVILSRTEINSLKKLGLNITCTDEFAY